MRSTPRPIQLPGQSSTNETRAAGPRGRVNVSWSSLDMTAGNATDALPENTTGLSRIRRLPSTSFAPCFSTAEAGVAYRSVARAGVLMALATESTFPAESGACCCTQFLSTSSSSTLSGKFLSTSKASMTFLLKIRPCVNL